MSRRIRPRRGLVMAGLLLGVPAAAMLLAASGEAEPAAGVFVGVRVPAGVSAAALEGVPWRYPAGAEVVASVAARAGRRTTVLSRGMHAAGGPAVSPDGREAAFAGQRAPGEAWRIWVAPVRGGRATPVSPAGRDCAAPVFLADGRVLASCESEGDWHLTAFDPRTGAGDQLTYGAVRDGPSTLLADGRILFVRAYREGLACAHGSAVLMTVRPDGTGGEIFYGDAAHPVAAARPVERADGAYWFLTGDARAAAWASIEGRSPFTSFRLRPEGEAARGFPPDAAWQYLEVVTPAAVRPKRLTSVVNSQATTGRLLCLDVGDSDLAAMEGTTRAAAVRVRTAAQAALGTAPVHADGSFFVEVPADTPLMLEVLDAGGRVLAATRAPLWVRPNETRGCIGCHEPRTLAPRNRAPLAVQYDPVLLAAEKVALPEVSGP